ncbi:unnamed protein product [Neospora caninum Liverpool]|nr:uncharacterized protein NCLIV_025610 [Neospora caninum Liverpool]CBZ52773.1 unnamed protein product [Neospora caninum Liverpool]|eukprot:XP_003882805.1 uncharacterized protein NCLIV_025610 [Neospora caninum Liverpool]
MAAQEVKRDAETEEKEKAEEQRRRQHREGREAPGRTAKGDGECGARGNVERGSDESETARGDAEANDQQAADERATDDSDDEPKVYRQPEGMIQYVFQWGIGNAFRAISANRFRPVHAARPKEVSIHPSYFESPHPCLIWEPLNEAWEVYFYENLKKSAKPFPVKKFGIARAKREALAFLKQMEEEGRMEKPTFSSGVEGVTFDQVTGSWICRYVDEDGRCMSRGFGADFHGFEEAKKLAIERQEAMKNLEADCLGRNMRLAKEK